MATKPRAKMVQRDATLDDILKSGTRYQQFAEEHPEEATPEPSSMTRRVLGDGGIALAKGVIGVPEAAVGLADLATGGQAGKILENEGGAIGFRPKMAKQFLDTFKSPEQQAADKAVQEAQGFVDTTVAALKNPSVVLGSVAESLPVMLGGGVVARSLLRMAPKALAAAPVAPVVAGAAGEGIVTAGSQAESIRQETPDGLLTGEQAGLAAASGMATGMLGYLGGKIAQRLGIADVDTMLAGKAGPEVTKGFTRRVLEGAVSEGLLEELPQSVQEQVAQNMALGKPLGEGVAQAAVLGALAGGLMGAGGNAISHGGQVRREKVDGTGAASRAINAGLEDTAQQADAIQAAAVQPAPQPAPGLPAAAAVPGPGLDKAGPAPADIGAAIAQREADRPAPPTTKAEPGEQVLTSMDNAMRAQQRAGEGAEIVPVAGGLVVRKVDAETGEIAPITPELPGVEPAPPAPPDPDPLPDDILGASGKPWPERAMAVRTMKQHGDGWTIAKVNGGFAVRKLAAVAAPIDANAHQAATSPTNDTPEPTEAQKKAGNYALGHHKLAGLDLSIENPAGSVRRGTDRDGKAWENQLQHHYGYIKGTIGNDKDHVDAFVKPGTPDDWNGTAFVVDQVHPDTGKFDESKVLLGFESADEARQAYQANYAKGWKGLRDLTPLALDQLKAWAFDKATSMMPAAKWKSQHGQANPGSARGVQDASLQAVDQRQGSLQQPQEPVLPQLRGAGDQSAPGSGGQLPGIQAGGGAAPELAAYAGAQGQQQGVRAGQPGLGDQEGTGAQPAQEPPADAGGSDAANRRVGGGNGAGAVGSALPSDKGRNDARGSVDHTTPTRPAENETAPADRWAGANKQEREQHLIRAGWKPGSPDLDAMKGKRWDEFTPSQKARVEQAINAKKAAADEAARPQAQAAGAEGAAPAAAPAPAAPAVVSGAPAAGVEAPGLKTPAPKRWEGLVVRPSPRDGEMFVSEPANDRDGGFQNLATFKVRADGKAGKVNQYHANAETTGMVEKAVARWNEQQAPAPAAPEGAREKRARLIAEREAAAPAPAPAAEKPADPDAEKKAKALSDLNDALGDLAGIFGKDFKANMLPEQEQKLMPVLTRVMDAAFRAGYYSFKQAARFVLDTIRERISPDVADAINLDMLQGSYIAMSGKYKEQGATSKRDVVAIESLDELAAEPAASTELPTPAAAPAQSPAPQPPAATQGAQNVANATPALDQPGAPALAGVPAGPVQGADGQRAAGDSAAPGGRLDGRGNVEADRPGRAGGRGLPGGSGTAPVPATGAGGGAGAGADRGVSGPGGPAAPDAGLQRPVAPPEFARKDFRITDETRLGEGGPKTKYRQNVAAIRLINELEASGRPATVDEQNVLARYVGWGALSQAFDPDHKDWTKEYAELKELLTADEWAAAFDSTQYAHYTSEQIVVDGIYAAVRRMGFNGGKTLELGGGVGNFIGLMPGDLKTGTRFTLVERERISARIAKHLYPEQNVQLADATEFRGNDDYYDGVFGNPPFASTALTDISGRKHLSGLSVHNYFFAKSVDMLRPGGILAQVVSNSFMDAGRDRARRYIGERTKLLGAIRLPNNAFAKNAGTEVTTDLIFLQKLPEAEWGTKATREASNRWMDQAFVLDPEGGADIPINRYFQEHPEMMLGVMGRKGTMYRADQPALVARPGQDTGALLAEAVARLPANVYVAPAVAGTATVTANLRQRMADPGVEVGGFFERDGKLFERVEDEAGEPMVREITPATQWTEKQTLGDTRFARIKQLAAMRVTLRALIAAEMAGENRLQPGVLRQKLNEQYDAYVKEHGPINDKPTVQAFGDDPDFPLLASLENNYKPGMGAAAAKTNGVKPFKAKADKAPIFSRSVVAARQQVMKATTPADALAVSMAERGRIDAAYMSQLLGKDAESILAELASGDRPLLFKDPAANEYVLRDAYLSGNVRKKLDQAKAANMFDNVRALEDVQPADVGVHEIHVRIGSPWVPTKVYEDFATSILGDGTKARIGYLPMTSGFMATIRSGNEVAETNTYGTPKMGASEILEALLNNRTIKITYTMEGKTYTDKEGTEAANLKAAEMRDKFQDWVFSDPDRAEVLARSYNDENNNYVTRQYDGAMMTFPGKVPDEIIKFRRHQRNAIARIVQDRTALLDHVVGAGKTFTVISAAMELKRTGLAKKSLIAVPNHLVKQWAADFYRLYPGANILAATKKDFLGPNRRRFLARIATGDWDAVILAHSSYGFIAPAAEFEQEFNQRQVADIMATIQAVKNDGDEKDPKNKRRIKALAKMKEGLEQRIKALRDRPMDSLLDFGQLGVDQLFVDEAHMFKNLMFSTKMQGVSGLGDGTGSQRAYDMYVKTQQVMEANGRGQGVVFATGTPISNSLAEMYHMQRYLMPTAMVEGGFQSFDAWANTYASVDQVWMQKISGDGFKVQNRMSTFVNTPELLKMFDQVSDTVTMDDIKRAYSEENDGAEFPLPKLKTGRRQPVSLAKSAGQESFMKEIADRAAKLEKRRGPPQKGDDNHLTVMGDARKAAMDIRLVRPDVVEREAGGRIDRASDEVLARYKQYDAQKGTQIVFSDLGTPLKNAKAELAEYAALKARADRLEDEGLTAAAQLGDKAAAATLEDAQDAADEIEAKGADWLDAAKAAERGFSVYDDFSAALIEKGVPAAEIAFIHDYNTDDQKAALFRKMNAGEIRVLMGSTPKLGAGTNVQDRLVALHHLDVPWKPSDVEQREGRIVRQGNLLATVPTKDRPNPFYIPGFEVEILAYVTRDTLDMRMWQIQEAKLKMINQLRERKVGREVDNAFQDMEMSAGEMQASATGNMDLLREIQLRNDVKLLEQKKRAFDAQRSDLASRRKDAQRKLDSLPKQIAALEPWAAAYDAYVQSVQEDRPVDVTVDGKRFTSRTAAQDVLRELTQAHDRRLEERRAIIKANNGAELTDADRAQMQAQADALLKKGTPADTEEGNRLLNVLATVRPVPKMPKLAVEFNGETYGSTATVAEAFTEATGDSSRIDWTFNGKTYIRRTAIAKALQETVAKAVKTDSERAVGGFGPYSVVVEGGTSKYGKTLDVQVTLDGKTRTRDVQLSVPEGVDPGLKASDVVESISSGIVNGARSELDYARHNLQRAQKAMADLDATAAPDSAWPGEAELERARATHREILQRLANGGAKPQADDGMGGSTNVAQTGNPVANDTDVVFADLSRVGDQIARQGYERADVKRMQAARRLQGILDDKAAGKLTPEEFDAALASLSEQMADVSATKQANRLMAERQRGADILREKLIRARRTGDLDADAVGLGLWLVDKNPDIASDLSVSILSPNDNSPAGDYNPVSRVIRLFKETGNGDTIAHEILHHAERMMPPELQGPIRAEWAKQLAASLKAAQDQPKVLAALQDMLAAAAGNSGAYQRTVQAFKDGVLDYGQHYQLFNASEFWAVNGARILSGRYDAQGSWVAEAKQWLRDLVQYIRGALGLRSDAPVLRALADITDPGNFGPERGGDYASEQMLSQGDDVRQSLGFKEAFSQAGASIRDVHLPANYRVGDFFNSDGRISWWHKTVGTMHNLAARSPLFKRTYDAVQRFVNDVSFYATEAANEAPRILPKLDKWRDILKSPLSPEQAKAIAAPIFEGTLTWARDISGKPVKVAELEAAAGKLDVHQKAQELLRRDMVDPKVLRMWQGLPMEQYEAIIETKYAKEALKPGVVWKDSELKRMFGLTEGEDGTIGLYREARRAIDKSLANLAIADMLRLGGDDLATMRDRALASGNPLKVAVMLRDKLYELAAEQPDRANVLNDTGNRMIDKADQVQDLMNRGYAPLSRFGQYTLDVVDNTGERVYFGLFESSAERAKMARRMRENFPGATIETGTVSQEEYRLFAGVSPETLELFGEFLGLEADGGDAASKAFQTYIKLTKSTRSAMKRLIERKGIDGFSEDVGRVLAGFVYSNARQTAGNLHQGEIAESVAAFPKGPGQMKDAAVQLMEYVKNPQEEAQAIRGWLFAQYLGGSVASALVNMTQPATVTLPYLSQFGGAVKATKRVAAAARLANKDSTGDAALDKALRVAEENGTVSPQEVHQLQAQAMGRATLRTGDGTTAGDLYAKGMNKLAVLGFAWGKLFGMAEQVNRRITFIAAYRTAVDEGMRNPAEFATRAVTETQFTYNKGNKPRWARGAVGSTLFTFKQYGISYLELMNRMWNAGADGSPERAAGRKAVLLAMAVLFLAGGADGLPFMEDAEDLLDAFMQRLGYNFSTKQKRHEFLADRLGDAGAQFVANGLSGLPGAPLDVSGRMGMGNLIPGTGLLPKKKDHTRDAVEVIGPLGDLAKRGFEAVGSVVDGEFKKAAQTIAPTAARNVAKAIDMATTGMYRDDRGRKVIDVDGYDALVKGLGFQPNDVAKVQEATGMVQNMIAQNKMRESEIADKWAIGIFEGDRAKQDEARAELARWNESNPMAKIRIDMPQVLKRVRAMRESKPERLAKTAPREIRAQVKAGLAEAGQ